MTVTAVRIPAFTPARGGGRPRTSPAYDDGYRGQGWNLRGTGGGDHNASREHRGHTWRWGCRACKKLSYFTFPSAEEAVDYGNRHVCPAAR